jgi:hypothetical protein
MDASIIKSKAGQETAKGDKEEPAHFWQVFAQVKPVAQRIQGQSGFTVMDSIVVILALILAAIVLRVEDTGSAKQIVMGTAAMFAVPTVLYTDVVFDYNQQWISHQYEMDYRRISPVAFQVATSLFTFPAPVVSIFIAVAAAYGVLEWEFNTYLVQSVFAAVHLLVALQFGRILAVLFLGEFGIVMKVYATALLVSAVFNSIGVPSNQLPDSLLFLFQMSINFWAISGAVVNQYNADNYSNLGQCFDFFTCLASEGPVIGQVLGFSPLSNGTCALAVLTLLFAVLVLLECALLYIRSRGWAFVSDLFRKKK